MSWTQEYQVDTIEDLISVIAGDTKLNLLKKQLWGEKKIKIIKQDKIILIDKDKIILIDDDYDTVYGWRIELSNGEIWQTSFDTYFTANGNYGRDEYRWENVTNLTENERSKKIEFPKKKE